MAPKCLLPTVCVGSFSSVGLRVIHRVQKDAVYDTDYNGINHIEPRYIGISQIDKFTYSRYRCLYSLQRKYIFCCILDNKHLVND